MYCNNCHQKLPDNTTTCPNCSTHLGELPWARKPVITASYAPKKEEDWFKKLVRKCLIATVVTLAIATVILLFKAWPGCFISAALLLFALITSGMCLFFQLPGNSPDFIGKNSDECPKDFLNHVVDIVLIWEGFWLAAGLACLALPWWAVMIAEMVNILALWGVLMSILEDSL